VDVSPHGAGTITLEYRIDYGEPLTPSSYPEEGITCFKSNNDLMLTANPASGYQFQEWEFSLWPADLSSFSDKTSNPIIFRNTTDDYPDSNYTRVITAHFTTDGSDPPDPPDPGDPDDPDELPAPENTTATSGQYTDKVTVSWSSAVNPDYYEVYRAESLGGWKTRIARTANTSYDDTNVTTDTVYYYWVKAFNRHDSSAFSAYATGYSALNGGGDDDDDDDDDGNDDPDPPPNPDDPVYGTASVTPAKAKEMLDNNHDVIVVDVSNGADFDAGHIICALNSGWNGMFNYFDYEAIGLTDYKDADILVYDQSAANSRAAAEYLAGKKGFSSVYYMTGGLQEWIDNGWETIPSDCNCEPCSLPPAALAGIDQTVVENEAVSLDGTGSQAADGGELSYAWRQNAGTDVVLQNAASGQATFTAPAVQQSGETLFFHLTVTDSQSNADTDSMAVHVDWVNDPPRADAGGFQSVTEGDRVVLDGSGSTDPDDGISSYQWRLISGPAVALENSTSAKAGFEAPAVGADATELVFELKVSDNGGREDTDRATIAIDRGNTPPVADAGPAQRVSETATVTLDASGSSDPDNNIESYAWTQISGQTVPLSEHAAVQPTFMAPEVEGEDKVIEFELLVTDSAGASHTDQVVITVTDAGIPPRADAGTDQSAYENQRISLDASRSTSEDGEITAYEWVQVSGPAVSLKGTTSKTPSFNVPDVEAAGAQLEFQLTVTDANGLKNTDKVKIRIGTATQAPVADAGADQEVTEGRQVVLDASGSSDADDGIKQYYWQQVNNGAPAVSLSGSSAEKPEFEAPAIEDEEATVLGFELTVTDYAGKTDTDAVEITVKPKSGGSSSTCFISTINP